MAANLKKFFRDLFTEKDNQTFDLVRVLAGVGSVHALGFQAWAVVKGQAFDFAHFMEGLATGIAGIGAAIAAKTFSKSENGQ